MPSLLWPLVAEPALGRELGRNPRDLVAARYTEAPLIAVLESEG